MDLKLAMLIGGAIILTAGAFALTNFAGAQLERAGRDNRITIAGTPAATTATATSAAIGLNAKQTTEGKSMDGMSEETREAAKAKLTPDQYKVCVMGGTEMPFNNKYYDHHADGTYHCIVCGTELFGSDTKYDSGSGWPSFFAAIDEGRIREVEDTSLGMVRTEVRCASCDAHLGHLFDDGPAPTGMRYCINSASLDFSEAEE